jgi:D-alanyl-D-alanine carboxypeptidase
LPPKDTFHRSLIAVVASQLAATDTPGASISLAVDGRPLLTTGVGHRDLGRADPLDAAARFYAYSITKTFLAAAVLRLAERDRLGLDDPIRTILPEVPVDDAVTVRRLLNHTAGLPDYGAMPQYNDDLRAAPGRPWTPDEFLTRTLRQGLRFAPGRGWEYSNIGYLLVRLAIERLTGHSLRGSLMDLVFLPLGRRRVIVAESLADTPVLAPGYSAALDRAGTRRDVARRYHPGWVSHGVVIATAGELAHALEGVLVGTLLRPESRAAMTAAVPVPDEHPLFARPAYGLGLMIDLASPFGLVAGHAGGGPGYSTAAFTFPNVGGRRVTAVALANDDRSDLALQLVFGLVMAYAAWPGTASGL